MTRKVLIGAASALALCSCTGRDYAYSGTLQAPSAAVGSTLGGRIVGVAVSEGAFVHKGDVLVRFDDAQPAADLAAAGGRLDQARAALADLLAGPRAEDLARLQALAQQQRAQAELAQGTIPHQATIVRSQVQQAFAQVYDAQAAARQADADADRMRNLFATGDVSAQELDAAIARQAQAHAELANRQAAFRAAQAQARNATAVDLPANAASAQYAHHASLEAYRSLAAGARPDQIRQAKAAVRAAEGDQAAARSRLNEAIVRAPADGVVTAMDLHPGDLVAPGASVATIDEAGNPYVRIFVPQSELGRFRLGTSLSVRSDTGSGTFAGVVEQIDSRAQFTPGNVQTASDRATLTFGVKVRVHDPQQRLHSGTTVEVALP